MDRKQAPAVENIVPSTSISQEENEELPPAYIAHGTSRTSDSNGPSLTLRPFPAVDYPSYRPASSTLSSDYTTITTSHRPYNKSASALTEFIRQQASLPPRPLICIKGTSITGTDFHVKLNLLPYLHRATDPWNYLTIKPGQDDNQSRFRRSQSLNKSLETWIKEYCSDQSGLKTFTLERQVINFDLDTLSGVIRNTFADVGYRGHLDIRLETAFSKVIVDNQSTKGAGAFFRPIVSAFIGSKNFEVVKAVWPFARSGPEEDGENHQQSSSTIREFASVSEASWWKAWKLAVLKAAVEKRRGWVTIEDRTEVLMTGWLQDMQFRPWGGGG